MLNDHIVLRVIEQYKEECNKRADSTFRNSPFNSSFRDFSEKEQIDILNELFKFQGRHILEAMDNLEKSIHLPGLGKIELNQRVKDRIEILSGEKEFDGERNFKTVTNKLYRDYVARKIERSRIHKQKANVKSEFSREDLTTKR